MEYMTKFIMKTLILVMLIMLTACNNKLIQQKMGTENATLLFAKGEKLTNGYFTGDAYLQLLLPKDKNNDFVIGSVTFEAGARTNWHTHPKGQVLIVTEGAGLYQEKGKRAQSIKKGDIINIPENTEHWHGALAGSKMVHIAITNFKGEVNAVWLSPVTDQEYSEANK